MVLPPRFDTAVYQLHQDWCRDTGECLSSSQIAIKEEVARDEEIVGAAAPGDGVVEVETAAEVEVEVAARGDRYLALVVDEVVDEREESTFDVLGGEEVEGVDEYGHFSELQERGPREAEFGVHIRQDAVLQLGDEAVVFHGTQSHSKGVIGECSGVYVDCPSIRKGILDDPRVQLVRRFGGCVPVFLDNTPL